MSLRAYDLFQQQARGSQRIKCSRGCVAVNCSHQRQTSVWKTTLWRENIFITWRADPRAPGGLHTRYKYILHSPYDSDQASHICIMCELQGLGYFSPSLNDKQFVLIYYSYDTVFLRKSTMNMLVTILCYSFSLIWIFSDVSNGYI